MADELPEQDNTSTRGCERERPELTSLHCIRVSVLSSLCAPSIPRPPRPPDPRSGCSRSSVRRTSTATSTYPQLHDSTAARCLVLTSADDACRRSRTSRRR
eukprot:3059540-Rhodomonas_salina.2